MIAPAPQSAPIGVYIHVPYCARICPYCDFNVYARHQNEHGDYVESLLAEIDLIARQEPDREIATIFIGGGTPSLLPSDDIGRMLDRLSSQFSIDHNAEITMEANPEGLEADYLRNLRRSGINRLSIGIQTHQARGLKVLGRAHKPETPIRGIAAARDAGFDNLSLDFIFGWPGQTDEDWAHDLDTILEINPEHASMYSLIIEPNTPYQTAVDRGILVPVDDERVSGMYEATLDRMAAAGWDHYEISNWARTPEYRSRHNLIYWRNAEYIALGPGAHGHLNGERYSNIRLPANYMKSIGAGTLPIAETEAIAQTTAIAETMMLGLRLTTDGVSASAFQQRHGLAMTSIYGETIEFLRSINMLEWHGDSLRLTRSGLLIANEVAERFLDPVLPGR
ncbi:MAG: radical SAM family heme chaperone HemW [Sphaerobacteraceae bacterium]|nr:MAG: radical SAM family heme chaperone HemW [Sphaerobacteraceae bacterium]